MIKKALFLLLLSFNFIFADNNVIYNENGAPIVISRGKPPAIPTSEGSTYTCNSGIFDPNSATTADVVKYFECITEKTLKYYKTPATSLVRRRNGWDYIVEINGSIYKDVTSGPISESNPNPDRNLLCKLIDGLYYCGYINTYYGGRVERSFPYEGKYDIKVFDNPHYPFEIPFKDVFLVGVFDMHCKPGEKYNTDKSECVPPCDASKGEFWSSHLNQCTTNCADITNRKERFQCVCKTTGSGNYQSAKIEMIRGYNSDIISVANTASIGIPAVDEANQIVQSNCQISCDTDTIFYSPYSLYKAGAIPDPNLVDNMCLLGASDNDPGVTLGKIDQKGLNEFEETKENICNNPSEIDATKRELALNPSSDLLRWQAERYNTYCGANIFIPPLNNESNPTNPNIPGNSGYIQQDPSPAPNPSGGGGSTGDVGSVGGGSDNSTSTTVSETPSASSDSGYIQQDPSPAPNPNEGKTDPITGTTGNDPFNNNNPTVRTGEGSTQGSTQSGEQGGQPAGSPEGSTQGNTQSGEQGGQPAGSAEGSQGGSAAGGLEGQTGGQGEGDGTSATGGEGEGNSQAEQGGKGQGEGEGNADEGTDFNGDFSDIDLNTAKLLNDIREEIDRNSNAFNSDFISVLGDLENFITDFKLSTSEAINEVKSLSTNPIKFKEISTCPMDFQIASNSVSIDFCKVLSPAYSILYILFFIIFLIMGIKSLLRLIVALLPALQSK